MYKQFIPPVQQQPVMPFQPQPIPYVQPQNVVPMQPQPASPMKPAPIAAVHPQYLNYLQMGWNQLQNLLPKIYSVVVPLIKNAVANYFTEKPHMPVPTKKDVDEIVKDISKKTEKTMKMDRGLGSTAQDLITIILLKEFHERRKYCLSCDLNRYWMY